MYGMKFLLAVIILISVSGGCDRQKNKQADISGDKLEVNMDTTVTGFFKRTEGAIAMDGGYTIPLSNGNVLWLFGDTYVDRYDSITRTVPCLFNVRNSALLQPYGNWTREETKTLLSQGEGPKNYLKNKTNSNQFIWPSSGVQLGDTIYVFCNLLKNVSGGLGFGSDGPPVWGKITVSDMKVQGFSPLPDFGDIGFGISFIKDENEGFVYVYGSRGIKGSLDSEIFLARFPAGSPGKNWRFWNGNSWSDDIQNITAIAKVSGFSWYISKVKDKYLLLNASFSLGCDQGDEIFAAASDKLSGPFSEAKIIYTIPDTVQGHHPFFYGVIAHPEYMNKADELLVTYSINGYAPCVPNCVDNRFDPDYYRLRGIRVPYRLIENL